MRILLFLATNLAVIVLGSITLRLLGVESILASNGVDLDISALLVFCGVFGIGGSLVSLFLSKWMAKMSTRTRVIAQPSNRDEQWLINTVEQLAQYVPYFHPEFLGVTGDFPDILSFARRFNAPFRKVTMEDGDYQIDHSANVVLINPKGDFHGFFRAPLDLAKVKVTLRSAQYYWSQQYD